LNSFLNLFTKSSNFVNKSSPLILSRFKYTENDFEFDK
jgi:hypothetical protein